MIPLHTGLDFVAFEAQGLELQGLSLVGLTHRNDVVQLAGLRSDGRAAELAHPVLFCQQSRSTAAGVVPAPLQQVQEDLKARPGQPLPSVGHAQALRPLLQHLRILAELPNHAVASRRSQAQGGPLAESSERHLGLVPRSLRAAGPARFAGLRSRSGHTRSPGPGLPLREFGSAGVLALPTVAMPLRFVAPHHGPGAFVEKSVSVPGGVGYGPFLLLHGLEAIQEPASAIDEEHGGVAPDAEGSDLCGRDPALPPVAGTDGIEVLQDVLQRELEELCQLPRHAEHVRALLEGAGQDLVSGKELVADLSQRSQGLA